MGDITCISLTTASKHTRQVKSKKIFQSLPLEHGTKTLHIDIVGKYECPFFFFFLTRFLLHYASLSLMASWRIGISRELTKHFLSFCPNHTTPKATQELGMDTNSLKIGRHKLSTLNFLLMRKRVICRLQISYTHLMGPLPKKDSENLVTPSEGIYTKFS